MGDVELEGLTEWSLGHFDDHDEKCFLQMNVIPGWCTCNTYREMRIRTIVDFALGRISEVYPYYDQLQSGELDEALRRIRQELAASEPDAAEKE